MWVLQCGLGHWQLVDTMERFGCLLSNSFLHEHYLHCLCLYLFETLCESSGRLDFCLSVMQYIARFHSYKLLRTLC